LETILIDLLFIAAIALLSYFAYEKKMYQKTFEYVKILILFTLSASFAAKTGVFLEKNNILNADTYSVIVLIGFGINLGVFLLFYLLLEKLYQAFITDLRVRGFVIKTVTVLQVAFIVTFTLYILMQLYIPKKYFEPTLQKTYTYTYVKKFYLSFINDDFVKMLLHANSKTPPHELIINSIKNTIN
jgi:hypothetical protein